jgi:archaemetzincin
MITLVPLGSVDAALLSRLQSGLVQALGFEIPITRYDLCIEHARDEKRSQYDSTRILLQLRRCHHTRKTNSPKLLAVFDGDLFIPVLTFVFGEAELRGNVAVVSFYRLDSARYGLPPDFKLLTERLIKESLHEIGHLNGLIHCREPGCVMRTSTVVEEVDLKSAEFCSMCSRSMPIRSAKA